jgi:hypothetical protein
MKRTKTTKPPISALVGHFFHSFNANGDLCWQGRVVAEVGSGIFLLQFYDWVVGSESDRKLVKLEDMLRWRFYESAEEMRKTFEHVVEPQQRQRRLHNVKAKP